MNVILDTDYVIDMCIYFWDDYLKKGLIGMKSKNLTCEFEPINGNLLFYNLNNGKSCFFESYFLGIELLEELRALVREEKINKLLNG